jgi:hypothetical protein
MKIELLKILSLLVLSLSNQSIYSQYAGKYENDKQLSLDGKYCIYRHDIGYVLMSDEKFEGTRLLKENEDRNKDKGFDLRALVGSWESKDTLQVYRFDKSLDQYKDTICRVSFEKYYDLVAKVKTYHSLDSFGYEEYKFDHYKLLEDKIVIVGTEKVFEENSQKTKNTMNFPLGGIKFNIKDGKIENIMVSCVTPKFDYEKEMEPDKYSNEKKASIEYLNLYFYPKKSIKIDTSNLRGVFLDIK